MKAIYGISNISPLILESYLSKYERRKKVKLRKQLLYPNKSRIRKNTEVIFSSNLVSVSANLLALNESKAVVFVFDSPLLLSNAGIPVLDVDLNKDKTKYRFIDFTWDTFSNVLDGALLEGNKKLSISNSSSLFLDARRESITQVLLALTLSSDEHKRKITLILVRWLMNKKRNLPKLRRLLVKYIEPEAFSILERFLSTDAGKNTIHVFDKLKKDMGEDEIKALCKGTNVPSFDVLYLLSQLEVSKNDASSKHRLFQR